MILFYTQNIEGSLARLPESEARHCLQVLRKRKGDVINFVDGKGGFYKGEIREANKRACTVNILEQMPVQKPKVRLHIGIAPPKNIDRFEWFLEKATEIGIDSITPILCEHSERRKLRKERLEKILLAAMKQSLKAYLPTLYDLTAFGNFVKLALPENCFIAHCRNGERKHLKNSYSRNQDVCLLIGPEGDFSQAEINQAFEHGFSSISLGESRLRTETAGIVACTIIDLINS